MAVSSVSAPSTPRTVALRDTGISLAGRTTAPVSQMLARDEQTLVVDSKSEGRYQVRLDRPNSTFEIRDERDRVLYYGRNSDLISNHSAYLSSGRYKVRVVEEEAGTSNRAYQLSLSPQAAERSTIIGREGGTTVSGRTNTPGERGLPSDSKLLTVEAAGEYNVRLNTTFASFAIRNGRGEVIASGHTGIDAETVKVRMVPTDSYTITVNQTIPSAFDRNYSVDIAPRINANIMSTGGIISGNMPNQAIEVQVGKELIRGARADKQSHTINFLADGEYTMNFLMPNGKFTLLDAMGKEVATSKNEGFTTAAPVTAKLKAGNYTLNIESAAMADTTGGSNWVFMVGGEKQKETTELSGVQKALAERDARLRREAAGGTSSSVNVLA